MPPPSSCRSGVWRSRHLPYDLPHLQKDETEMPTQQPHTVPQTTYLHGISYHQYCTAVPAARKDSTAAVEHACRSPLNRFMSRRSIPCRHNATPTAVMRFCNYKPRELFRTSGGSRPADAAYLPRFCSQDLRASGLDSASTPARRMCCVV